jgi:D-serine deaminase-like pyridoxal phosphate-dependent protein
MHSEEHVVIETPRAAEFSIGQVLHAFPKHICPTVALHSEAVLIEGGRTAAHWPIPARGRRLTV